MRTLITIIVVLTILVGATVTNPTRDEFINWGIAEIREQADNEVEKVFGGAIAAPMLEAQTEMKDYVFFSVFTIQKSNSEFKYLGVFNTFFELN